MTGCSVLQVEPAAIGYYAAFGIAGVVCLSGVLRAREIEQPAVRRGIVWLLGLTGLWALLKVPFFLAPAPFRRPLYTVGLIFGFATVWAWLYFCSAYTGRSYHRNQTLRRLGAAVFLSVVLVKLTNPIHGLYFSTAESTTPFTHLAIRHGIFHWMVTGLSYVLAAIGVFVLFELYLNSGYDTKPLGVLTVLIAIPVVFDVIAFASPLFIEVIYAPLGVAVFALGVLFIFERRFVAVQATGGDDDPVIFLDDRGSIRDYTPAAAAVFPELSIGEPLEDVVPEFAEVAAGNERILAQQRGGEQRYFLVSSSHLELGDSESRVVVFSDVTTAEQRRRELARHNQQLEEFADALTHELRNVLQIIRSRLAATAPLLEGETLERESVETAHQSSQRMDELIDDFTKLARYGQTVEELVPVTLEPAVEDAWTQAGTGEAELTVESTGTIEADPGRLRHLLINAFEFAQHNGASTVTFELLADGFAITDDGDAPGENIEGYFAFGEAVPDSKSGMKLPNVRAFARVHGWHVDIDTDYTAGMRVVVGGVSLGDDATSREQQVAGE